MKYRVIDDEDILEIIVKRYADTLVCSVCGQDDEEGTIHDPECPVAKAVDDKIQLIIKRTSN